jgi:malic enzyme
MTNKKSAKKKFNGMSYRAVQIANSKNRSKLSKKDQAWLKENSYKNIGWHNVINLYQQIDELLNKQQIADLSLEELFLEADRIGNKYLTSQEIIEFNQKLSIEVNEIAEKIEQQFPDTEIEFIDFSKSTNKKYRNKKYIKL